MAERQRMDDLLAAAREGRSASVVIRGEAGIGKTALLEYAASQAVDMQVLRACGVTFESEVAFSALHELVRPLLTLLDELPEVQADALRTAFALSSQSSLSRPTPTGEPVPLGDSPLGHSIPVNRLAVYGATLGLLAAAAERSPVLCLVDDAHWLDRASAEALLFATRRMLAERVVVLFATRDVPGFAAPGLPDLPLHGLDREPGIALATRSGMSRRAAARLVEATAGNPLALVELPATLTEAQRTGVAPLEQPLPTASQVEAAFLAQARSLDHPTWQALVVCAANETSELPVLARALAAGGLELRALDPAVTAGLLTVRADVVTFRHPLVRSAVYSAAGPGARQAAHLAIADALTTPAEADRRAWHLALAAVGPDEAVAGELAATAERARRRGGVVAEARAYERAARLSPDPAARADRLNRAGAAWLNAAAFEHGVALLVEAEPGTVDLRQRCMARSQRAHIELHHGRPVTEEYMAEAESYAEADPVAAGMMMSATVNACWVAMDIDRMLRVCRRIAELRAPNGPDSTYPKASIRLAAAQVLAGQPEGVDLALACVPICAEFEADGTAAELAEVLLWIDELGAARQLLEREIAGARELQDLYLLGYVLPRLAELEARAGRLQAAHRAAGEAVEVTTAAGLPFQGAHTLTVMAWVQALLGDVAECRRYAEQARTVSPPGYLDVESRLRYVLGAAALGAGRPADAVEDLEWADAILRRGGLVEPGWTPVAADLAEAYARLGRTTESLAAIERLESVAERIGRASAHAAAARCRALLAADADLDVAFAHALDLVDGAPPLERARTLLAYGQRLRRARRRREARDRLHAALILFDESGAAGWAAQCRSDLTATGGSPTRGGEEPLRLTPQEWQIALSAAEGLTNREIATRAFLSPKTVDYHLGNIYRKLGLHSRHELIRHLSR